MSAVLPLPLPLSLLLLSCAAATSAQDATTWPEVVVDIAAMAAFVYIARLFIVKVVAPTEDDD